ncbi:MAG: iron-sulfur cluster assembly scaffold protein [Nanoarchaeota archaeon]|nr:iron-sulfur cluster assembly scaffold protein [Nanoarchaeota archaeon]
MALDYTKEVMKHFTHPKNLGEMKDADGIGKVGNITCLVPGQKIHSNHSLIEIEKLDVGDSVLNHEGNPDKVSSNHSREHNGKVIELKNSLGKIKLTPEHLILAIKTPKGQKFLRNKWRRTIVPSWYHAADLNKRDIVLYPIVRKAEDIETIDLNIPKLKWDFRSKSIPKKIPINGDFLRLAGYYLSEGHASLRITNVCLNFSFHIDQKDYANDIKSIAKELFNLDAVIRENIPHKTLVVYLHSAPLTRFFKDLFEKGAENKRIPEFMMILPSEKQKELIKGLWRGDGYVNLKRAGPRAGYVTISSTLIQQIKTLLLRQCIVPSMYEEAEQTIRGVKHRRSFRIHVGQRESLVKLCKILNIDYIPKSYPSIDSWFTNYNLYTPITGINKVDYIGKVHNLEVENSHSFTSEAFTLHNCGDIIMIFIKIGKRKSGEEFIKDIKFKTLGCAAAIATTSMMTVLAKGKTLSEAMKITNSDVIKGLGGLPKIKHHCSLLAEEGLGEALYHYLKSHKKQIPKSLEAKHKRAVLSQKAFHAKHDQSHKS